jgi:DNA-binding ferritin-like protein
MNEQDFRDHHLLLDEQGVTDDVAERAHKIGGLRPVSLENIGTATPQEHESRTRSVE